LINEGKQIKYPTHVQTAIDFILNSILSSSATNHHKRTINQKRNDNNGGGGTIILPILDIPPTSNPISVFQIASLILVFDCDLFKEFDHCYSLSFNNSCGVLFLIKN